MGMKKTLTGLLFLLIFAGGVFGFFYFSYGDYFLNSFKELFPNFNFFEFNGYDDEEVIPPEGLIREDEPENETKGFLTRAGIIEETNNQRAKFNENTLLENEKLNEVAIIKLDDMFEKQYFAHVSPEGEGVGDIAKTINYNFLLIGDNLAMGLYRDDEDVVSAWMNSPGHRTNILNSKYQEIGVAAREGEYNGKTIWMAVQVFAMPTSACPLVDESLIEEMDRRRNELQAFLDRREQLEGEMDRVRPRGGEEHLKMVEEYNSLGVQYNEKVFSLDRLIEDYNKQIKLRDECVSG